MFLINFVIFGIIISSMIKIVGLWVLLYCVNGAQKNWKKLEKRFLDEAQIESELFELGGIVVNEFI